MKTHTPHSKEKEAKLLADYYESGDLNVLGQLYEPYMTLIYGLSLKYLKDQAKSEDAVMQIFESLIKKLRIHQVEHFKSWLYMVSKNHCLMQLRTQGKEIVLIDEAFMESIEIPHQNTNEEVKEQHLLLMEKCIEELKPEQQLAVRLFYLEEKCYQDIADSTGFGLKKVKSYIQNGCRNSKICMEKTL